MGKQHIMLSYQWNKQELAEKVYNGLRNHGINAWMDVHGGMKGNINDSMAEGVDGAATVCCFMTADYSGSRNCKKELNYADSQTKVIVPLMCEKGFKAQGWLGIITAGLLWIDFRDETTFENSIQSLAKEIINSLESGSEDDIKMDPSEMSEGAIAHAPQIDIQKKPGRAFLHKLTGQFLAESGQVKFHPQSGNRSTLVMRDQAEDTSYWVEEKKDKSEIHFFKNYATNGYLGYDPNGDYIYTKGQHYGAEEWILKSDDQSTDGRRAVVLFANFGKRYLAIRSGKLTGVSSYSEDCVWILD
ncbi:hypothetical protein OS493_004274 [Desmophyllum pertusum]|uniref:TIR domain-containing protein n=1 Tax=Desmophyllum pertusum TaxID=174260 RepID=A0A9W9ZWI9_9CNID|nr:hypothetical protein OS493_004274 [Desmophyllum pertusum]